MEEEPLGFRNALEREETSVVTDGLQEGGVIQVAFGGVASGLGMPPFEFYRMTASFPTGKVFVRDLSQAWYHGVLPGVGVGVEDLAAYLDRLIRAQNPQRVVFFGNSMGAYAAILLGAMVGVDQVVAFAPQTFIGKLLRLVHRDFRWRKKLTRMYRSGLADPKFFDLKRYLPERDYETSIDIHASGSDRLDRLHARRMEGIQGVRVHTYDASGHHLVKSLRDDGSLERMLVDALTPP